MAPEIVTGGSYHGGSGWNAKLTVWGIKALKAPKISSKLNAKCLLTTETMNSLLRRLQDKMKLQDTWWTGFEWVGLKDNLIFLRKRK